jgi:catechol 2,3-dioxygenase-like lactoylglutathione lyase family enzyme
MINTLQHVGVGVTDIDRSSEFYRKTLQFGVPLNGTEGEIEELIPMFGSAPRMRITNAFNAAGGASIELFQHMGTPPRRSKDLTWGSTGFLELGIEVRDLERVCDRMKHRGVEFLTGVIRMWSGNGTVWRYAYFKDPDGLPVQLLDLGSDSRSKAGGFTLCGVNHVGIGVEDIERSTDFYRNAMGFDRVAFSGEMTASDAGPVMPCPGNLDVVMLERSSGSTARFSSFTGGMIKLVCCKDGEHEAVFAGRRFGDVGLVEIGLDVDCVESAYRRAMEAGARELVPPTRFSWKLGPCGTLAYIEDPDGNVIELVKLKSVFGIPARLVDLLVIRPLRTMSRLHLI